MLATLARALPACGWETAVAVFDNVRASNTAVADALRSHAVAVLRIRCNGRVDFGSLRGIRRGMNVFRPDVIHTHGYKADVYGYLATRKTAIPVVSTCHNWPSRKLKVRLYYWLDRAVLRNFDRIAAVSDSVARLLRKFGISNSRLEVIYNGIDVDRFAQPQRAVDGSAASVDFKVGVIGRLVPEKGHHYLLKALQQLANPRVMLIIVGEGPEQESIWNHALELGISKQVFFGGHRNDMPEVYASLDAVVLPSVTEGMPMAILEAMAAGKPVIATAVGSVETVVKHGVTGLLIEPRSVDALCAALRELITNQSLRQKFGANGQGYVRDHFSAAAMAKKYSELYRSALDGKTRPKAHPHPLQFGYGE